MLERGRDLVDRVAPEHLDNERRLLAALTPKEQTELAALVRKLLLAFEATEVQPAAVKRRRLRRRRARPDREPL